MHLVSGVNCQEFGQVVNGQVIHTTLNWAKKVMVKMWDVDGLVDNQGEHPPGLWVIIGNYTAHSLISFFLFFFVCSKGLVIAHNGDRSIIV
jgi:hypothetical protein